MRKTLLVAALSAMLAMTANVRAAEQKTGTIIAIDNSGKTFICQWGGEDRTYKTTDKTVYRVGTKNGTWSDLKLGERVNIFYRVVDNERVADRVTVEKR